MVAENKNEMEYAQIKTEINDTFFNVESIDAILSKHNDWRDTNGDKNGKKLYSILMKDLQKRGKSEEYFIMELCQIIMQHTNFEKFEASLEKKK